MKRRTWPIFSFLALFFVLTLIGVKNGEASDCYLMFVNWDCLKEEKPDLSWKKYQTSMYVAKHKDGSIDIGGFVWGVWSQYGKDKSLLISFPGGCNPLYFGVPDAYGFMICSDSSSGVVQPGCWHWKKVKASSKTCWWMNEGLAFSATEAAESDEAVAAKEEEDDED